MLIDWQGIALAAKRANTAYLEEAAQSKAAFSAMGDTWIDMLSGIDYQAVLSADSTGATHLSISGTRASQAAVVDVFDDADIVPVTVAGGTVTAGVQRDQDKLWDWGGRPPIPHVWLKSDAGEFQMIPGPQWPNGWDFGDHDVSAYQVRLERIAAAQPEAA